VGSVAVLEKGLKKKRPEPVGYKKDQYDQHSNSINSIKTDTGFPGLGAVVRMAIWMIKQPERRREKNLKPNKKAPVRKADAFTKTLFDRLTLI
jgi:hypothetical protein